MRRLSVLESFMWAGGPELYSWRGSSKTSAWRGVEWDEEGMVEELWGIY